MLSVLTFLPMKNTYTTYYLRIASIKINKFLNYLNQFAFDSLLFNTFNHIVHTFESDKKLSIFPELCLRNLRSPRSHEGVRWGQYVCNAPVCYNPLLSPVLISFVRTFTLRSVKYIQGVSQLPGDLQSAFSQRINKL